MDERTDVRNQQQNTDSELVPTNEIEPDLVEELEKELEATGKRSLNYSIILILIIIPFLLLLFFISSSSESPYLATHKNHFNTH